jgi:hypothetical protein
MEILEHACHMDRRSNLTEETKTMIKKAIGIAALILVIFVIAIGVAKANPASKDPGKSAPHFFAATSPDKNPASVFPNDPFNESFVTPQAYQPTFMKPDNKEPEGQSAAAPKKSPKRDSSHGPQFSKNGPAKYFDGPAGFKPDDDFESPFSA